MKKRIELTDKLLLWLLGVSLATALFHTTIPAVVGAAIHLTVAAAASAVHIYSSRTRNKPALKAVSNEMVND